MPEVIKNISISNGNDIINVSIGQLWTENIIRLQYIQYLICTARSKSESWETGSY